MRPKLLRAPLRDELQPPPFSWLLVVVQRCVPRLTNLRLNLNRLRLAPRAKRTARAFVAEREDDAVFV